MFSCNTGTSENKVKNDSTSVSNADTVSTATIPAPVSQTSGVNQIPQAQTPKDKAKNQLLNTYSPMSRAPVPFKDAGKDPKVKEAEVLYNSASKKAQEGDHAGAVEEYTKSMAIYKTAIALMKRGYSYIMLKNYQAALTDLNDAIKINPTLDQAYFARGICRFEMMDFKGSEEDMTRYIKKDQKNPLAYNYMAGIRFMQKDYKGAMENYDQVVKLDPAFPDIYTNRGMMRHYQNDLTGAVADYNEALKLNPSNSSAYNNRGAAKLNQQDYQGAFNDFDQAIKLKPDYADAYDNRGKCRYKLGDQAGACDDWRKAFSLGLIASNELIEKFCK